LFSAQELDGYRANSVAYGVAWLAKQSGWRINLDRIWEAQCLSPALCEALKLTCRAAHEHITAQQGNPGEASKKVTCWEEFQQKELPVGNGWRDELADMVFMATNSEEETLSRGWESIRRHFTIDARTMGELEVATGKVWIASRRTDLAKYYAERT